MNAQLSKKTDFHEYIDRAFSLTSLLILFIFIVTALLFTQPAYAADSDGDETTTTESSQLDDFETAGTTENSQQNSGSQTQDEYSDENDPFADFFADILDAAFDGIISNLGKGAEMSLARVNGPTNTTPLPVIEIRQAGEPTLPFVQMGYKYLQVNPELSASDYNFEFGYGSYGYEYQNTYFTEINPKDNMTLIQQHLLLRISGSRSWEYGIGVGTIKLCGNEQNSGFSITAPIKIYLNQSVGFNIKPTFSDINGNSINSNDLSIVFTKRFVTCQIGYRILETNGENLNGSYIGFAFHY